MTEESYTGNVILNSERVVTLDGGWNSSFTAVQTKTTIQGALTIIDGTLVAKDLVLR